MKSLLPSLYAGTRAVANLRVDCGISAWNNLRGGIMDLWAVQGVSEVYGDKLAEFLRDADSDKLARLKQLIA